ncbi:iron ABC transporter permease [Alphaproteobacteria bacterium]|nr:iron ABC transporter permease [Alphaproteobacteria bacterium]
MINYLKHGWGLFSVLLCLTVIIPISTIIFFFLIPGDETWIHLRDNVLNSYISNSLYLMIFVGGGSIIIGSITAWLVAMYDFPFKKYLEWLLFMPLAIPSYAVAYCYADLLGYGGFITNNLGLIFNSNIKSINFYSIYGAVFVFIFSLYPYVYLLMRQAFISQSSAYIEIAKISGLNLLQIIRKICLPLSRPALAGGVTLVIMETLADYGVSDYLGINTFTKGIYKAWFNLGDITSAGKLSAILLFTVAIIIIIERKLRGKAQYNNEVRSNRVLQLKKLHGFTAILALFICIIPVIIGFIIPLITLISWSIESIDIIYTLEFINVAISSFGIAFFASLLCALFALIIVFGMRTNPKLVNPFARIASLGYSIPGAVAAIGVLIPLVWLDNTINNISLKYFNYSTGLIITGTWFGLLFAYLVRFLALSMQAVENSFIKISKSIDYAARILGKSNRKILTSIHIKIGWGGISLGLLIVFVDVLKELPATMILRPFGLSTLAIKAHELAIDERLYDASIPLLTIIFLCLIPLYFLTKVIRQE